MKTVFTTLLLIILCIPPSDGTVACILAQTPLSIELIESSAIADNGLYFTGSQGVDYQFGRRITPHGDCIDVVGGYQFVTWYKGGMDKRDLMPPDGGMSRARNGFISSFRTSTLATDKTALSEIRTTSPSLG